MAFPWGGDVVVLVVVIIDVIVVIVVVVVVIVVVVVGHKTRLRLYLRLDPKTLKCSSWESARANAVQSVSLRASASASASACAQTTDTRGNAHTRF